MTKEELRAKKARNLRYKKPIATQMNLETIKENLWEMQSECSDVRYFFDDSEDPETLLGELLGDEGEAYEFRMMFSDLSAECDQFLDDLSNWEWSDYLEEYFNLFMVLEDRTGHLAGYDTYEHDYFGLESSYEKEAAIEAAHEKLKKELTKDKLLEFFQRCMRILVSYCALQYRYDCLKASLDIVREQNAAHLMAVKEINALYTKADEETRGFQFCWRSEAYTKLDEMIKAMPQEAFM